MNHMNTEKWLKNPLILLPLLNGFSLCNVLWRKTAQDANWLGQLLADNAEILLAKTTAGFGNHERGARAALTRRLP